MLPRGVRRGRGRVRRLRRGPYEMRNHVVAYEAGAGIVWEPVLAATSR